MQYNVFPVGALLFGAAAMLGAGHNRGLSLLGDTGRDSLLNFDMILTFRHGWENDWATGKADSSSGNGRSGKGSNTDINGKNDPMDLTNDPMDTTDAAPSAKDSAGVRDRDFDQGFGDEKPPASFLQEGIQEGTRETASSAAAESSNARSSKNKISPKGSDAKNTYNGEENDYEKVVIGGRSDTNDNSRSDKNINRSDRNDRSDKNNNRGAKSSRNKRKKRNDVSAANAVGGFPAMTFVDDVVAERDDSKFDALLERMRQRGKVGNRGDKWGNSMSNTESDDFDAEIDDTLIFLQEDQKKSEKVEVGGRSKDGQEKVSEAGREAGSESATTGQSATTGTNNASTNGGATKVSPGSSVSTEDPATSHRFSAKDATSTTISHDGREKEDIVIDTGRTPNGDSILWHKILSETIRNQ
jgi:hypothetical protein